MVFSMDCFLIAITSYNERDVVKDYGKGIHKFLCLEDKLLYLSLRDPAEYIGTGFYL